MISADAVTKVVAFLAEHGRSSVAPYAERQRTFWMHDDLPFHMVNMSQRGQRVAPVVRYPGDSHWLGEEPMTQLLERSLYMRQYDLRRHCDRDRAWTMRVNEQMGTASNEVRYACAEVDGDKE